MKRGAFEIARNARVMRALSKPIHCSTFTKHATNYKSIVTVNTIPLAKTAVIHANADVRKNCVLLRFQYVNVKTVFGGFERKSLMQVDDFALI
jgi:hypothetical protein